MRNFSRYCLARPVATSMAVLSFSLLGAISVGFIPVSLMPHSSFPGLTVEVRYGGVGPEKIEQTITIPIEEAVSAIGGIEELTSVSEEGKSRVDIQFARGTDLDLKSMEVRERIEVVAADFPREVQHPALLRYDPDRSPVMIVALESEKEKLSDLREFAERETKKALEGVADISEIIVAGGQAREIIVEVDRDKLKSRGLAMSDLLRRLQEQNLDATLGDVRAGGGDYPLLVVGRFRSLKDIHELVLQTGDQGRPIRIRDVAQTAYGFRDQDTASRYNNEERVSLYLHKSGQANLLNLSDEVRAILARLETRDIQYRIIFDQADQIRAAFGNLVWAVGAGGLLAGLVLYLAFLSQRVALIVIGALPVSFLIASFFLYLTGFEYNLITLSGLILSSGVSLLIMTLAVFAIRRHGPTAAAERSGREVLAGVIVLAAIFVPVSMAGEDLRAVYGGLAVAVIVPVLTTLLLSITIVPVLLGRRELRGYQIDVLRRLADVIRARVRPIKHRLDHRVYRMFPLWMYDRLAFAHERRRNFWLAYGGVVLLGLLVYSLSSQEYAVGLNRNYVNAQIEFPSGTSFGATNAVSKTVEKKLIEVPGVVEVTSRVEPGKGTARVKLAPGERVDAEKLEEFRQAAGKNEPAFVFFGTDAEAGSLREITIHILGEDLETLDKITRSLADAAKNLPGVSEVVLRYKSPRPEMRLIVDRVKAEQAGLTPSSLGDTVRFAIQGAVATKFFEEDREVDVRIRYAARFRKSLEDLGELFLKALSQNQNAGSGFVPALELARLEEGTVPVKIYRKDKKRSFSFSLQTAGDIADLIGPVRKMENIPLPENYRIQFGKEFRRAVEGRRRFLAVNLLSLLLIYMILASYFESLRRPLLLFVAIPVPLAGVLGVLFLLRIPLSVSILIALLILAGLVAMQAMLFLRFAPVEGWRPRRREQRMTIRPYASLLRQDASVYLLAGGLSAVFFLPLTLLIGAGGEFLRGMAICLSAGLLISCISTPLLSTLLATISKVR
jgi:multidrug efflux pump subunit AcrB